MSEEVEEREIIAKGESPEDAVYAGEPKEEFLMEDTLPTVREFVRGLEGTQHMLEFFEEHLVYCLDEDYKEGDDLNWYDYNLHQHLIDAQIGYAKLILDDVKRGSKKRDLQYFVERTQDQKDLDWHDVYQIVVERNRGNRFAKHIQGRNE